MRTLVACKRVIDHAVRIRIATDGSGVDSKGVKHSMNPFDEIAVEEALRWRESRAVDEVVAASCGGDKQSAEVLKTALAMGADRAVHFEAAPAMLTPLAVAKVLRRIVEKEKCDVVIMGKQAIDDDCGQTGQLLAGLLGWPQATFVSKTVINRDAGTMEAVREVDGGLETLKVKLPAVVTVDLRLNEPRYATLQNIMKAKGKPLTTMTMADLGLSEDDLMSLHVATLKIEEPEKRKSGIKVGSVDELMEKIKPILKGL